MFKDTLHHLNLRELSELAGNDVVEALDAVGVTAKKTNLIDVIISTSGLSVLSKPANRKIYFQKPAIREELSITEPELKKFTSRPWASCYKDIGLKLNENVDDLIVGETRRAGTFDTDESFALMPYQNWMRKRVLDQFTINQQKKILVHMPTGAGKTSTAMQIIVDYFRGELPKNTSVVWMAHSDELCEQAVQSFAKTWPSQNLGQISVWRAWGGQSNLDNYDGSGGNLIVTSFQTLYSWQKTGNDNVFKNVNKLKRNSDFLVVDEAHLSTAPTFKSAIEYVAGFDGKILGLTATPGKHHVGGDTESTNDLVQFYNQNLLKMTDDDGDEIESPIEFLQNKKVLSSIETRPISGTEVVLSNAEVTECLELFDLPESVLNNLGQDHARTLKVAQEIIKLVTQEKLQTIVFCPSKTNAVVLAEFLKINECKAVSITGDTDTGLRRESLEKFKDGEINVITNYGVLTTGFDAPNIGAVVIARPTLSVVLYSQMVGRGIRGPLFNGTDHCIVLNVEDNIRNLPNYVDASVYFNEFYGSKKELN